MRILSHVASASDPAAEALRGAFGWLFLYSPNRRRPRLSAGNKISLAADFLQKQPGYHIVSAISDPIPQASSAASPVRSPILPSLLNRKAGCILAAHAEAAGILGPMEEWSGTVVGSGAQCYRARQHEPRHIAKRFGQCAPDRMPAQIFEFFARGEPVAMAPSLL